jgi:hypothetical protein
MFAKVTREHVLPFIGFSPEVGTICLSQVLLTVYQTIQHHILELMLFLTAIDTGSKHHSPVDV